MGYGGRDVEVVSLNQEQFLVVACDSCGAIGPKELDCVQLPASITGRLTVRVALLEVLVTGAVPKIITVAISNELEQTGLGILEGVRDELSSIGLAEVPMVISTEKNVLTRQTGLGISVVGICNKQDLRIQTSKPGDFVYSLGLPKVGSEVTSPVDPEIIQGQHVMSLLKKNSIHDILPIGSRGIRAEAEQLARNASCQFNEGACGAVNLIKSAGPSTCLIFTSPINFQCIDLGSLPFHKLGNLTKSK